MSRPITPLELSEFIAGDLRPRGFPTFAPTARKEQIAWRTAGFRAWRRGEISFRDFLTNIPPGSFKSAELQKRLQAFLDREIDQILQRANLYTRSATLLGLPFCATEPGEFKNWRIALKLINEIVLDDEYRARKHIEKDSVVIDAGANIGVFSALAATLATRGQVFAFEPTKATFGILKENVRQYPHVTPVQSGLGNEIGSAELGIENSTGVGNSLVSSGLAASYGNREMVPVTTIDAFVREHHLSRVDFIKMDTEGFESEIIEGAKETIKKHRPTLALSAYHKPGDPERLQAMIAEYCPDYRFVLKRSPELDLICDVS